MGYPECTEPSPRRSCNVSKAPTSLKKVAEYAWIKCSGRLQLLDAPWRQFQLGSRLIVGRAEHDGRFDNTPTLSDSEQCVSLGATVLFLQALGYVATPASSDVEDLCILRVRELIPGERRQNHDRRRSRRGIFYRFPGLSCIGCLVGRDHNRYQ